MQSRGLLPRLKGGFMYIVIDGQCMVGKYEDKEAAELHAEALNFNRDDNKSYVEEE